MPLSDFQRLKGNDARESRSLQTDLENVVRPRWAPICKDREKIVPSDVLVCEMANRKVELRILAFQSALHSLAGFLRLRGIGTRGVVLDLLGVSMGKSILADRSRYAARTAASCRRTQSDAQHRDSRQPERYGPPKSAANVRTMQAKRSPAASGRQGAKTGMRGLSCVRHLTLLHRRECFLATAGVDGVRIRGGNRRSNRTPWQSARKGQRLNPCGATEARFRNPSDERPRRKDGTHGHQHY